MSICRHRKLCKGQSRFSRLFLSFATIPLHKKRLAFFVIKEKPSFSDGFPFGKPSIKTSFDVIKRRSLFKTQGIKKEEIRYMANFFLEFFYFSFLFVIKRLC
jgi:hypothetical protein